MEDPGGGEDFALGGWAFQFERGAEGDKFKLDELMAADALLLPCAGHAAVHSGGSLPIDDD